MKIKTLRTALCVLSFGFFFNSHAQSYVTYNHDDAKMNQITVQEIGAGGLTPAFYYDVFHNSYQKSAAAKNKLGFRTLAGVAAWQQIEDADSVETSMKKRAEIEALNIADRQIDIAWLAEGNKIESKLNDFQNNINRIVSAGGSFNDKERWTEYYNIFQTSIKETKDAYMPNAQRKKEYLAIYADICKQNETLIAYIVQINNRKKTEELLSATNNRTSHKSEFATAAYNRWRSSAWGNSNNGGGNGGEGNIIEE
ncbi:MAG: DUF5045 domain-containing protein [Prevotella sp.]|nr:DUF5045 domain-containing protein [Prevotella sp.]